MEHLLTDLLCSMNLFTLATMASNFLNEERDLAECTSSGRSLTKFFGASCTKLRATLVFTGLVFVFLHGTNPCNVSDLMTTISDFWHYMP